MFFTYTDAEFKELNKIKKKYIEKIDAAANEKERAQCVLQMQEKIETYERKREKAHFNEFAADPEAILQNAQEQAPHILKVFHSTYTKVANDPKDHKIVENFGKTINGTFYMYADYAASVLRRELELHRKALLKDPDRLQRLFDIIINAINDSGYTTGELSAEVSTDILQIMQTPLQNYSMSIDAINQQFFGSMILPQKGYANGQEILYLSDTNDTIYTNEKNEPAKNDLNNLVSYSFWFNESLLEAAGIKLDINYLDFYVMQTLYNLEKAGNKQTSATAVAKILGYGNSPSHTQIEKIRESITKCSNTTIRLNNLNQARAEGLEYYMETDYKVLPYRIINQKAVSNGKILESYIKLDETNGEAPILLRMAEASGFVTTIPLMILHLL